MRNIFLSCTIIFAAGIGSDASGQWTRVTDDLPSYHYKGIDFANNELGFAVADGAIMRTEDGGHTWTIADTSSFKGSGLFGVTADSTIVGIVVVVAGSGLTLGRSVDGGHTWRRVHSGSPASLSNVCYRGDGRYAAFGAGAWLVSSLDYGLSWSEKLVYPSADMDAGICRDDGALWAGGFWNDGGFGGCCGVLMSSVDDGKSWSVAIRPISSADGRFFDVEFLNDSDGYAISSGSQLIGKTVLWRTSDGGATWERYDTLSRMHAIDFQNEEVGLIVGDHGIILSTTDGGETWAQDTVSIPVDLYDVAFTGDGTAAVVGDPGIYLSDAYATTGLSDDTWSLRSTFQAVAYPNPASARIWISVSGVPVRPASSRLRIVDALGRAAIKTVNTAGSGPIEVPIDGLSPGRYLFELVVGQNHATGSFVLGW